MTQFQQILCIDRHWQLTSNDAKRRLIYYDITAANNKQQQRPMQPTRKTKFGSAEV